MMISAAYEILNLLVLRLPDVKCLSVKIKMNHRSGSITFLVDLVARAMKKEKKLS